MRRRCMNLLDGMKITAGKLMSSYYGRVDQKLMQATGYWSVQRPQAIRQPCMYSEFVSNMDCLYLCLSIGQVPVAMSIHNPKRVSLGLIVRFRQDFAHRREMERIGIIGRYTDNEAEPSSRTASQPTGRVAGGGVRGDRLAFTRSSDTAGCG